jgi:hypothetical protein
MSRLLIGLGLIIVLMGITWPWLTRLGLGRLPGDIVIERENFRFYFPLPTSIIVSIISARFCGCSTVDIGSSWRGRSVVRSSGRIPLLPTLENPFQSMS